MASSLFQALKPVCIMVAKDPTTKNLLIAEQTFTCLQQNAITESALLEYLIFPFDLSIKKKLREEQEIVCFQCLSEIYSKCKPCVITSDIFLSRLKFFSVYFLQTINHDIDTTCYTTSEEQRFEITNMLNIILNKITETNLINSYKVKYLPLLGHVVSILLFLVESEKNLTIQLKSLECLENLAGFRFSSDKSMRFIGSLYLSFFPGISEMFNRVLVSPTHQNHKIIQACLICFARFINIVLYDDNDDQCFSENVMLQRLQNLKIGEKESPICKENITDEKQSLKQERTSEWLKKTKSNIDYILKNVLPVVMCHSHSAVRNSLVSFTEQVLLKCMYNLMESVPEFIFVLSKMVCDEYADVKENSRTVLNNLQIIFNKKDRFDLQGILNEKLHDEILSLPRIMNSASSDDLKIAKLQVIKGFIQFYGEGLKYLLCSLPHLERFITALLQILELDTSTIYPVQEHTYRRNVAITDIPNTKSSTIHNKQFKYFTNAAILDNIEDIIHLIAKYGDKYLIVDYILEKCLNSTFCRLQAIIVINEVINGYDKKEIDEELSSLIDFLVETYIQDDWWNLPISNSNELLSTSNTNENYFDKTSSQSLINITNKATNINKGISNKLAIPFEILNRNIQFICILLEGISVFAKTMKNEFNLIQVLYRLLEKVGSVNATISKTAIQTLHDIVEHCNYESIANLILHNSDYLINSVSLSLRNYFRESSCSAVLCVILEYSDQDIVMIVADALEGMFKVLDLYQEDVAYEVLNVLSYMAQAVDKHFNHEIKVTKQKFQNSFDVLKVDNDDISIVHFFTEHVTTYLKATGNIEGEETEELTANEEEVNESPVDDKKEIPIYYQVIVTALKKCVYFVTSPNLKTKLKAFDVIQHSVVALRTKENDLLPLINQLWPAILRRLKENDQVILLKGLDVVCTMVEIAKDFMRKRLTDEFLPFTIHFLSQHSSTFRKGQSMYSYTNKVLVKLINFLGLTVPAIDVPRKIFCDLCACIVVFLDCRLHVAVQEAGVSTLQKFYAYNPDIVWLLAQTTAATFDALPPTEMFQRMNFLPQAYEKNIYSNNISKILVEYG